MDHVFRQWTKLGLVMFKTLYYYFFKPPGEALIASFEPRSIKRIHTNVFEFYSHDKRYVFSYDMATDTSEIWQEGSLIYKTQCAEEAFKLYIDVKCRRIT